MTLTLPQIKGVLQPGDIFLTRNANEEDNPTPGYWNHCAAYAGADKVVEAQSGPGEVITSNLDEFLRRYPRIRVLRLVGQKPGSGVAVAYAASALVGRPYSALVSRFKRLKRAERRGENCVTVVRRAMLDAIGEDPQWKIPDDVDKDSRLSAIPECEVGA
jgi:cell wall-associated NlpC family hydrolase